MYKTIETDELTILSVERLQNPSLWQGYVCKRRTIVQRESSRNPEYNEGQVEKRWLFHGTDKDTVEKIYQMGFNRIFAGRNMTRYGKGSYFARDAAYSLNYSRADAQGKRYMLLNRVAIGECGQGEEDIPEPPKRPDARAGEHLLYDSTVDKLPMKRATIFVTYHDAQAYPEYLVTYKQIAS